MRLLNTTTLKISSFNDDKIPIYAILSHTWGSQEATFQDINQFHNGQESVELYAGFSKIRGAARICLGAEIDWLWIDTCCIDKSNSVELSESINSMYRYYADAKVCFAYLDDYAVNPGSVLHETNIDSVSLAACRWFTRGWCLQELIAPWRVIFFGPDWQELGSKARLVEVIHRITRIDRGVLLRPTRVHYISVAERMSWASERVTTRKEDMAYCLLGIFDVNMPLIYGEGHKAFRRLQETIMQTLDDQSILAWGLGGSDSSKKLYTMLQGSSILATDPSQFANSNKVVLAKNLPGMSLDSEPFVMSNKGLRLSTLVIDREHFTLVVLACTLQGTYRGLLAIPVRRVHGRQSYITYRVAAPPICLTASELRSARLRTLQIVDWRWNLYDTLMRFAIEKTPDETWRIRCDDPNWCTVSSSLSLRRSSNIRNINLTISHILPIGSVMVIGLHITVNIHTYEASLEVLEGHHEHEARFNWNRVRQSRIIIDSRTGQRWDLSLTWIRSVQGEKVLVLDIIRDHMFLLSRLAELRFWFYSVLRVFAPSRERPDKPPWLFTTNSQSLHHMEDNVASICAWVLVFLFCRGMIYLVAQTWAFWRDRRAFELPSTILGFLVAALIGKISIPILSIWFGPTHRTLNLVTMSGVLVKIFLLSAACWSLILFVPPYVKRCDLDGCVVRDRRKEP